MEKAFGFLREHRDVAFATVADGRPKLRVFRIMKIEGTDLYFATAPGKEVYSQLTENPFAEILAMEGDISVRVAGRVDFAVPNRTEKEIYRDNPVLPRLYASYTDLVYFRLIPTGMDYYDLSEEPPLMEHRGFTYGTE